jgi:hypothetical protein
MMAEGDFEDGAEVTLKTVQKLVCKAHLIKKRPNFSGA